jgi:hypothetical protein
MHSFGLNSINFISMVPLNTNREFVKLKSRIQEVEIENS